MTGYKSRKHFVLSYDYRRPNDPSDNLPLSGTIDASVATHVCVYYDESGDLHASNFFSSSDERLKYDINDISLKSNGVLPDLKSFKFKVNDHRSYGVIAQEVESLGYTELVDTDDNGYKRVNYDALYALYIKDLQNQIDILKREIEELKR